MFVYLTLPLKIAPFLANINKYIVYTPRTFLPLSDSAAFEKNDNVPVYLLPLSRWVPYYYSSALYARFDNTLTTMKKSCYPHTRSCTDHYLISTQSVIDIGMTGQ